MSNHSEVEHHEEHHSHLKLLGIVFGTLLVFTVITVLVSFVDFGADWANIVIAMAIASVKASLVAVYFMHLKWEDKLTWGFACISFPLLALLIGFDLWDIGTRVVENLYGF